MIDFDDMGKIRELCNEFEIDIRRENARVIMENVEKYGELDPTDAENFLKILSQMILKGDVIFNGPYTQPKLQEMILMPLTSARVVLTNDPINYDECVKDLKGFMVRYYNPVLRQNGVETR